jgi:hypothetical protein
MLSSAAMPWDWPDSFEPCQPIQQTSHNQHARHILIFKKMASMIAEIGLGQWASS